MNILKNIIARTTGYWLHKCNTLPVGADLFVDLRVKLRYSSLQTFFDVGANTGQTARWFRYNAPDAMIHCFEPVQATFHQLCQKTARDSKCFVQHMALGDQPGEKKIRLFEDEMAVLNSLSEVIMNNREGAREETIRIETLDRYCRQRDITKIDLLKIDTEGYEINVLSGAKEKMRAGAIPLIFCETGFQKSNMRNTYFPLLSEFLAEEGYYFFGLYQMDYHDWKRGNHLGNALYVHKTAFP